MDNPYDKVDEAAHNFHRHLDACAPCEHNPFALCMEGQRLLAAFATARDTAELLNAGGLAKPGPSLEAILAGEEQAARVAASAPTPDAPASDLGHGSPIPTVDVAHERAEAARQAAQSDAKWELAE